MARPKKQRTKKGPKAGRDVTDIASRRTGPPAPKSRASVIVKEADYPHVAHACDLMIKHVAKTRKALLACSLPTGSVDSLKVQAEEAQRLLRLAQGDSEHAPTATFTMLGHISAVVRVGLYLHLNLLEKVKHQQETQGVARPEDTSALIRTVEKLADRLSDQLQLFEDTGINQRTLPVVRAEDAPDAPEAAADPSQTDLGVGGDGLPESDD